MGRAGCTESQCLYSTAIPLLPSVPVQYSYTSTPLSACTRVHFTSTYFTDILVDENFILVDCNNALPFGSALPIHHTVPQGLTEDTNSNCLLQRLSCLILSGLR